MFQLSADFKKLIKWLIPVWLRQSTVMLVLQAAMLPVRQVYNTYVLFVKETLYRLQHNGQICYLRKVLNDKLDVTERRILLEDFEGLQRFFFWAETDLRDVNFENTVYFWPDDMYADSGIDFVVKIPYGIVTAEKDLSYLHSLLKEYKLASKNYTIIRY